MRNKQKTYSRDKRFSMDCRIRVSLDLVKESFVSTSFLSDDGEYVL